MEGDSQIKPVGGYFELADREELCGFPHKDGILLNTGRNALEYILLSLGRVRKVYLPLYTCEVVLEPLRRLGIPWQFYHINKQFELAEEVRLDEGEYIVLNNYLGIKDQYVARMVPVYGNKLIVDCAQAFFAPVIDGIKCFYSARKFVGVSDGGVAYSFCDGFDVHSLAQNDSSFHSDHLFIRKEKGAEAGFSTYQDDEEKLNNQIMQRMSSFTEDILKHINYDSVIDRRRKNYQLLESALRERNHSKMPSMDSFKCPMAYPYMVPNGVELRKKLIVNKVFVPKFWPNSSIPDETFEGYKLSDSILPLPIDQRYGEEDMKRIIEIIN